MSCGCGFQRSCWSRGSGDHNAQHNACKQDSASIEELQALCIPHTAHKRVLFRADQWIRALVLGNQGHLTRQPRNWLSGLDLEIIKRSESRSTFNLRIKVSIWIRLTWYNNTDLGEHDKGVYEKEKCLGAMIFLQGNQRLFNHHALHIFRFLKHLCKFGFVCVCARIGDHLRTGLPLLIGCLSGCSLEE